jgi:hypothetical protein
LVWKIIGYDTYCIEIHDPRNNLDQSVEQEGDDFGGGTGDGPSPEDYTEILDCAGVPGGTAIFSEECKTCIGGSTGIEKCADIKHELDSFPCAKELVLQMSTLNSDISTLIKNAFGKNDNINLIIKADFTLVGTNTDGQTGEIKGVQVANKLISYNATIGINPDILRSSTKEYILVTIYHEALHAYLGYKKLQLGVTEFNHQFTGLYMNGGRLIGVQDPDHWTMGYAKFVNGLKNIILAFNPNFSEDRAYALAKYGIMTLSPSENLINQQERNTSFTGYKGTKCP